MGREEVRSDGNGGDTAAVLAGIRANFGADRDNGAFTIYIGLLTHVTISIDRWHPEEAT